jgi:hypothetical protein
MVVLVAMLVAFNMNTEDKLIFLFCCLSHIIILALRCENIEERAGFTVNLY